MDGCSNSKRNKIKQSYRQTQNASVSAPSLFWWLRVTRWLRERDETEGGAVHFENDIENQLELENEIFELCRLGECTHGRKNHLGKIKKEIKIKQLKQKSKQQTQNYITIFYVFKPVKHQIWKSAKKEKKTRNRKSKGRSDRKKRNRRYVHTTHKQTNKHSPTTATIQRE